MIFSGCASAPSKSDSYSSAKEFIKDKYGAEYVMTSNVVTKSSSLDLAALDARELTGYLKGYEDVTFTMICYNNLNIAWDGFPTRKYSHDIIEYAGIKESGKLVIYDDTKMTTGNTDVDAKLLNDIEEYIEDVKDILDASFNIYLVSYDEDVVLGAAKQFCDTLEKLDICYKNSCSVIAIVLKDKSVMSEFDKIAQKRDNKTLTLQRIIADERFNSGELVDKYYMCAKTCNSSEWYKWFNQYEPGREQY